MHKISRLLDFIRDTFLVTQCTVCMKQTEKGGICSECLDVLDTAHLASKKYSFEIDGRTVNCVSVFSYEFDQVKSLVLRMKANPDRRTFIYCASRLAGEIRALGIEEDAVVTYVPRSNEGLRKYGFDQSQFISRIVSDVLPFASYKKLIKRTGKSKAQKRLSGDERKENVKGKFCAAKADGTFKNIVIIDDVCTTGSSLRECAAVLKEKYPEAEIFCVTVAKNLYRL